MPISAQFTISAMRPDQYPKDRLPEIALAGRSNVGKSSLINRLLGMANLARTSNTPGRTQTLNFYRVRPEGNTDRGAFYLVDMPGYGYAQVSAARRAEWAKVIDAYLSSREPLRGVIQLIDMRHPPQPLDRQMTEWLQHFEHHFLLVGTKADKVAKTKVPEILVTVAEALNVDSNDTVAFSAETGLGRDAVWRWILDTVAGRQGG